ncbi:hypothetical protein [Verminephrobacter aporrectodeae]|uniref:hypothetical protein n=1 Tax=Verminephrobacter aporrectodeae TaxID=1110389 RepID=UPI0002EC54EC|nr:hypothetical protein [Verminephrobacter aporrectodeae]
MLLFLFVILVLPLTVAAWIRRTSPVVLMILPITGLALLACAALNFRGGYAGFVPKFLVCAVATGVVLQLILQ